MFLFFFTFHGPRFFQVKSLFETSDCIDTVSIRCRVIAAPLFQVAQGFFFSYFKFKSCKGKGNFIMKTETHSFLSCLSHRIEKKKEKENQWRMHQVWSVYYITLCLSARVTYRLYS